jgi:1-phosphatidylinositol-4-phosphate 5-kinase
MSNVFKTTRDIQIRFDLKGSTYGRRTKKTPGEAVDSNVALKDLDFIDMGIKINLTPSVKK